MLDKFKPVRVCGYDISLTDRQYRGSVNFNLSPRSPAWKILRVLRRNTEQYPVLIFLTLFLFCIRAGAAASGRIGATAMTTGLQARLTACCSFLYVNCRRSSVIQFFRYNRVSTCHQKRSSAAVYVLSQTSAGFGTLSTDAFSWKLHWRTL